MVTFVSPVVLECLLREAVMITTAGNMCPSSTRMCSKSKPTSGLVQVCSIQLVLAELENRMVQLDRPVKRGERHVARLLQMQLPTPCPNKQEMRAHGPCLDVHGAVRSPTLADEGGGPKHSVQFLAPVPGGSSVEHLFSRVCLPRMVPTTVERLREGQGVRERLLRGIKVERSYKRADGSTEMESGESRCYIGHYIGRHYSSLLSFMHGASQSCPSS